MFIPLRFLPLMTCSSAELLDHIGDVLMELQPEQKKACWCHMTNRHAALAYNPPTKHLQSYQED